MAVGQLVEMDVKDVWKVVTHVAAKDWAQRRRRETSILHTQTKGKVATSLNSFHVFIHPLHLLCSNTGGIYVAAQQKNRNVQDPIGSNRAVPFLPHWP